MSRPGKMDEMKKDKAAFGMATMWSATAQREMTGAANLMAQPMAAATAAGALTLGMAGHAYGIWLGTMAGAVEASQRLMFGTAAADRDLVPGPGVPHLRLVAGGGVEEAGAAMRTLAADAERIAQDTIEVAIEVAEEMFGEAAEASGIARAFVDAAAEPAPARAMQPKAIGRPEAPDNLKAIAGIGPKLEKVLNDLGIWTYSQIASLKETEVAWLDERLGFAGRIGRDDWLGQARKLRPVD